MGAKKIGRPKNKRPKVCPPSQTLRLKYYEDMPSSKGGTVSGSADQFGRIMVPLINSEGHADIGPNGHTIYANH